MLPGETERFLWGLATRMPIIDITLLDGREEATKRLLMREITDLVERCLEVPRSSVRPILREVPRSNFAVGGVPKHELDAAPPA